MRFRNSVASFLIAGLFGAGVAFHLSENSRVRNLSEISYRGRVESETLYTSKGDISFPEGKKIRIDGINSPIYFPYKVWDGTVRRGSVVDLRYRDTGSRLVGTFIDDGVD